MEKIHLIVQGRVQGVGFRYHTRMFASQVGVTGYVKNQPDGTVEIVAEGTSQALRQLLEWAKQGPSAANVRKVSATYEQATGGFASFSVEH